MNTYSATGEPGALNLGRFQWDGEPWVPEGAIVHLRARDYSPRLGRFLQTDPAGPTDSLNLYLYAGNDPLDLVDPTGLESTTVSELVVNGRAITQRIVGVPGIPALLGIGGPTGVTQLSGVTVTARRLPPRRTRVVQAGFLPQNIGSQLQKLNSSCKQVANEPGPVFVDFVGGDFIAGVGFTGSVGVFKNLKTGSGGFFVTGGGGIGASFGPTIQGGFYRSVADLQGVNANVGAAVPGAAGSLNFSPDGRLVGGSVGTGTKLGVSGTVTNTWLVGCSVGGH